MWGLLALALLTSVLSEGCVTVYQPLVSLQRPVVVDPGAPNLEGVRLRVRCIPGDPVDQAQAQILCRKATALFSNQGASVQSEVPRDGRPAPAHEGEEKPDLVVDLRTRLLHAEDNRLLAALYVVTLTLVPMIKEESFAQDITIRDAEGALLATDSLQARFIQYIGAGVWAVNWVLDFAVREEADEITGEGAKEDFSRDLYAQLSQLVFNAHVRSRVLRGFAAAPPAEPNAAARGD